ncbi:PUA domain-containing protein [Halosimplex amylolyticum]|uniref:PUA domain-containing protein n=1 Tax=Halosimplex amylolyticum TaxID=3396616 RepID=UPI003F550928
MDERDRAMLTRVADYQWGGGAGAALFADGDLEVTHTSSGRPRQVIGEDGRLVTYATDGRFTLGVAGGRRLDEGLPDGCYRVVVGDESEPFVRDGRNAFAKFVGAADPAIRPGDEVVLTHERGEVLAVGRAELSGQGMLDFETGVAVFVRDSVPSTDAGEE